MAACQVSEAATTHQIQSNSACEMSDAGGGPGLGAPVLTEEDDNKQLCCVTGTSQEHGCSQSREVEALSGPESCRTG